MYPLTSSSQTLFVVQLFFYLKVAIFHKMQVLKHLIKNWIIDSWKNLSAQVVYATIFITTLLNLLLRKKKSAYFEIRRFQNCELHYFTNRNNISRNE